MIFTKPAENIILFIFIAILLYTLIKFAKGVEKQFESIAKGFKLNEFFLGFVVLGFITSLPEISIAVFSSKSNPSLSASNLIGATIILLTLVIGVALLKFGDYEFKRRFSELDVRAGLLLLFLIIIAFLDKQISSLEGLILIILYFLYVVHLSRKLNKNNFDLNNIVKKEFIKKIFTGIISATVLIIAAYFIVQASISLAFNLGISVTFIGIFVLALGTNIPELSILFTSKNTITNKNFAIGNFFGSAVINTGIIGFLAVISGGIKIENFQSFIPGIVILTFTLILFIFFSWTGKKLTKTEGVFLIAAYFSLIISELLILAGVF